MSKMMKTTKSQSISDKTYDVFICHASEDKDKFVRQLAEELKAKDINVWYDDFTLKIGDSLRQSIEKGLLEAKFGIVVLSPNFFKKQWPQDELNGLYALKRQGKTIILPIWLNLNEHYISKYSPILADLKAAKASDGYGKIVTDIINAMS